MAQELTNKKLFYNKVDCNKQLPGVTQWTKIQDQLKKKKRNNSVNKKGTNKEKKASYFQV